MTHHARWQAAVIALVTLIAVLCIVILLIRAGVRVPTPQVPIG